MTLFKTISFKKQNHLFSSHRTSIQHEQKALPFGRHINSLNKKMISLRGGGCGNSKPIRQQQVQILNGRDQMNNMQKENDGEIDNIPEDLFTNLENHLSILIQKAHLASDEQQKSDIFISIQWFISKKEYFNILCQNQLLASAVYDLIIGKLPSLLKSSIVYLRQSSFLCLQVLQIGNDLVRVLFTFLMRNEKRYLIVQEKSILEGIIQDLETQLRIESSNILVTAIDFEIQMIKGAIQSSPSNSDEGKKLFISFIGGLVKSVIAMSPSGDLINTLIEGGKFLYKEYQIEDLKKKYEVYYYFESLKWYIVSLLKQGSFHYKVMKLIFDGYKKYIENSNDWLLNVCWVSLISFLLQYRPIVSKKDISSNIVEQQKCWNYLISHKYINQLSFDNNLGKLILFANQQREQELPNINQLLAKFGIKSFEIFQDHIHQALEINKKKIFIVKDNLIGEFLKQDYLYHFLQQQDDWEELFQLEKEINQLEQFCKSSTNDYFSRIVQKYENSKQQQLIIAKKKEEIAEIITKIISFSFVIDQIQFKLQLHFNLITMITQSIVVPNGQEQSKILELKNKLQFQDKNIRYSFQEKCINNCQILSEKKFEIIENLLYLKIKFKESILQQEGSNQLDNELNEKFEEIKTFISGIKSVQQELIKFTINFSEIKQNHSQNYKKDSVSTFNLDNPINSLRQILISVLQEQALKIQIKNLHKLFKSLKKNKQESLKNKIICHGQLKYLIDDIINQFQNRRDIFQTIQSFFEYNANYFKQQPKKVQKNNQDQNIQLTDEDVIKGVITLQNENIQSFISQQEKGELQERQLQEQKIIQLLQLLKDNQKILLDIQQRNQCNKNQLQQALLSILVTEQLLQQYMRKPQRLNLIQQQLKFNLKSQVEQPVLTENTIEQQRESNVRLIDKQLLYSEQDEALDLIKKQIKELLEILKLTIDHFQHIREGLSDNLKLYKQLWTVEIAFNTQQNNNIFPSVYEDGITKELDSHFAFILTNFGSQSEYKFQIDINQQKQQFQSSTKSIEILLTFIEQIMPQMRMNSQNSGTQSVIKSTLVQGVQDSKDYLNNYNYRVRQKLIICLFEIQQQQLEIKVDQFCQNILLQIWTTEKDERVMALMKNKEIVEMQKKLFSQDLQTFQKRISLDMRERLNKMNDLEQQIKLEGENSIRQQLSEQLEQQHLELEEYLDNITEMSSKLDISLQYLKEIKKDLSKIKEKIDQLQFQIEDIGIDVRKLRGKTFPELLDIRKKRILDAKVIRELNSIYIALKVQEWNPISGLKMEEQSVLLEDDFKNQNGEVNEFLQNDGMTKDVMLLRGVAGSGKSRAAAKIEEFLWEKNVLNESPWIPIYVSLPTLKEPKFNLIDQALESEFYQFDKIQIREFKQALRQKQLQLVLILDSYDEMKQESLQSNLFQTNRFTQDLLGEAPNNRSAKEYLKVIITTRTEILTSSSYQTWFYGESLESLKEIELLGFDKDQEQMYLQQYTYLSVKKELFELYEFVSQVTKVKMDIFQFSNFWRKVYDYLKQMETEYQPFKTSEQSREIQMDNNQFEQPSQLDQKEQIPEDFSKQSEEQQGQSSKQSDILFYDCLEVSSDNSKRKENNFQNNTYESYNQNPKKEDFIIDEVQSAYILQLISQEKGFKNVNKNQIVSLNKKLIDIWSVKKYQKLIININIEHILTTPFMMEIVVQVLPSMEKQYSDTSLLKKGFVKNFVSIKQNQQIRQQLIEKQQNLIQKNNGSEIIQEQKENIAEKDLRQMAFKIWDVLEEKKLISLSLTDQINPKYFSDINDAQIVMRALILKTFTVFDFYISFVDFYHQRQIRKLMELGKTNNSDSLAIDLLSFSQSLALDMIIHEVSQTSYRAKGQLNLKLIQNNRNEVDDDWQDTYFNDFGPNGEYKKLIRSCCLLSQKGSNHSFTHKSIQEFYIACYLLQVFEQLNILEEADYKMKLSEFEWKNNQLKLASGEQQQQQEKQQQVQSIKRIEQICLYLHHQVYNQNQFNTTTEQFKGVLTLIKEEMKQSKQLKENLIFLVKLSQISSTFIRAASNSIYLLSYNNQYLGSQQLQNIKISNTDLLGLSFFDTNLQGSIFNDVNISSCNFNNANLKDVKWNNIKCNELPILKGHTTCVSKMIFSPDNTMLLSEDFQNTQILWNVTQGKRMVRIENSIDGVVSQTFLEDGRVFASSSTGSKIQVRDIRNKKQMGSFQYKIPKLSHILISQDCQRLVSQFDDGRIQLWNIVLNENKIELTENLGESKQIHISFIIFSPRADVLVLIGDIIELYYVGHKNSETVKDGSNITQATFSSNNVLLALGRENGQITLLNVFKVEKPIILESDNNSSIYQLIFSPDEQILASSNIQEAAIRLWNTVTGQQVTLLQGHTSMVTGLVFNLHGQILASCSSDTTIRFWNIKTFEQIAILQGHKEKINLITFSQNGGRFASCGDDNIIRVWDVKQLEMVCVIQIETKLIRSIVFSPNCEVICSQNDEDIVQLYNIINGKQVGFIKLQSASKNMEFVHFLPNGNLLIPNILDSKVHLWDVEKGGYVATLEFEVNIFLIVLSPNGQRVATVSKDNVIALWNVTQNNQVALLKGHSGFVNNIVFSPQGDTLASSGRDKTVRLWESKLGKELFIMKGHTDEIRCITFSKNGQIIASGGDENEVRLWDCKSGKQIAFLLTDLDCFSTEINKIAFSFDNQTIALIHNQNNAIRLWNFNTQNKITLLEGHIYSGISAVFSPTDQILASCSNDSTIRLWDVQVGKQLALLEGHQGDIYEIVFSANGNILASGGKDKLIRLWDVKSSIKIQFLAGHSEAVQEVQFSPDGQILASLSNDQKIGLWDAKTGSLITLLESNKQYQAMSFSPDGELFAYCSNEILIIIWDFKVYKQTTILSGHCGDIDAIYFAPNGQILISKSIPEMTLRLWDVKKEKQIAILRFHEGPKKTIIDICLSFQQNGQILAFDTWDTEIKLWDVLIKKQIASLKGHTDEILGLEFSTDDKILASFSKDKTIRLWEVKTGKYLTLLLVKIGCFDDHSRIQFSPNNQILALHSDLKAIRIWNIKTGKQLKLKGHKKHPCGFVFSPDSSILISYGYEKQIRIWDVETGKKITIVKGHSKEGVNFVIFSPDGQIFVTKGWDKKMIFWSVKFFKQIAVLKGHTDAVSDIIFSRDGSYLVSCGDDKSIRFWQRSTKKTSILQNDNDESNLEQFGMEYVQAPNQQNESFYYYPCSKVIARCQFIQAEKCEIGGSEMTTSLGWNLKQFFLQKGASEYYLQQKQEQTQNKIKKPFPINEKIQPFSKIQTSQLKELHKINPQFLYIQAVTLMNEDELDDQSKINLDGCYYYESDSNSRDDREDYEGYEDDKSKDNDVEDDDLGSGDDDDDDDEFEKKYELLPLMTYETLTLINQYVKTTKQGKTTKIVIDELNSYKAILQLFESFILQSEAYFFDINETYFYSSQNKNNLTEIPTQEQIDEYLLLLQTNFVERTQQQRMNVIKKLYFPFLNNFFDFYLLESNFEEKTLLFFYEFQPNEESEKKLENFLSIFEKVCSIENFQVNLAILTLENQEAAKILQPEQIYLKYLLTLFTILYERQVDINNLTVTIDTIERAYWAYYDIIERNSLESINKGNQFCEKANFLTHQMNDVTQIQVNLGEQVDEIREIRKLKKVTFFGYQSINLARLNFLKNPKAEQLFILVQIILENEFYPYYLHLSKVAKQNYLKIFIRPDTTNLDNRVLPILLRQYEQFTQLIYINEPNHFYLNTVTQFILWHDFVVIKGFQPEEAMTIIAFSSIPYRTTCNDQEE